MQLLPKWCLYDNKYTFYDMDAKTMLELASTLHGAMNALISDYNTFVDNTNKLITDFMNDADADRKVFETAMRQEFQDFIDIIDLKVKSMENEIGEQNKTIEAAVKYMKDNLYETVGQYIGDNLNEQGIKMATNYNEETEELTLVYVEATE